MGRPCGILRVQPHAGWPAPAQSENPDRIVLVDVSTWDTTNAEIVAAAELGEPELALRGGRMWLPRINRLASALLNLPDGESWALGMVETGTLGGVGVVRGIDPGAELEPDEIRVAVRALGLNFRDVLIALGMYPDNTCH